MAEFNGRRSARGGSRRGPGQSPGGVQEGLLLAGKGSQIAPRTNPAGSDFAARKVQEGFHATPGQTFEDWRSVGIRCVLVRPEGLEGVFPGEGSDFYTWRQSVGLGVAPLHGSTTAELG